MARLNVRYKDLTKTRKQRLVVIKDACSGELGLALPSVAQFNTGDYIIIGDHRIIAHDMLEHPNCFPNIGGVEDEFLALGGMWYIRGEWGDLSRPNHSRGTAEENIGKGDFLDLFGQLYCIGSLQLDLDPFSFRVIDPDLVEYSIDHIWGCIDIKDLEAAIEAVVDQTDFDRIVEESSKLFALGYAIAERKYKNQSQANAAFWSIAEACKKVTPQIEFEGQQFMLTYSCDDASIREVYSYA